MRVCSQGEGRQKAAGTMFIHTHTYRHIYMCVCICISCKEVKRGKGTWMSIALHDTAERWCVYAYARCSTMLCGVHNTCAYQRAARRPPGVRSSARRAHAPVTRTHARTHTQVEPLAQLPLRQLRPHRPPRERHALERRRRAAGRRPSVPLAAAGGQPRHPHRRRRRHHGLRPEPGRRPAATGAPLNRHRHPTTTIPPLKPTTAGS